MTKSHYRCPQCGYSGSFTIYGAIEIHRSIRIDGDGSCHDSEGGDIEWTEHNTMECRKCEHKAHVVVFIRQGGA